MLLLLLLLTKTIEKNVLIEIKLIYILIILYYSTYFIYSIVLKYIY